MKAMFNGEELFPSIPEYTAGEGIEISEHKISSKLPTIYLTQPEYNALTEEQKNAEVLYLVDEAPWVPSQLSVQDYDTENGWHVRKWSDGYVEMVLKKQKTIYQKGETTIGKTDLNAPIFELESLPVPLIEKYSENVSVLSSTMGRNTDVLITGVNGFAVDNLTTNVHSLIGSTAFNTLNVVASIVVTGRWK